MNKENKIKIGDILEGSVHMNSSGGGYLVSNELPKDIYLHSSKTNKALHLDTVKIEVIEGKGRLLEGRVIEIIKRFKTEFVGTLQVTERFAFLVPDSPKMTIDIFIPLSKLMGGKDGQKAVGRLTNWKNDAKSPNGEIIEILGEAGDNDVEIHSILNEYSLPYKFPDIVIDEANSIPLVISDFEISKRKDFRKVLTICIDPKDSRDKDDSVSIQWINGEVEVGIHIADVLFFVRPDSELYKEAYNRGNSIYLVDRVVPMFPERLSNNVCSLNPNQDKLAFSAVFRLDKNGNILSKWFGRTVININKDYSYEAAQSLIDGLEVDMDDNDLAIIELNKIAKILRKLRTKDNPLSLNNKEIKIKLDENSKPIGITFKEQKDANHLIEDFMLLANKEVCEFITKKGGSMIHRYHDIPDQTKLQDLKRFVETLGYKLNISDDRNIKTQLNNLIEEIKGSTYENLINTLVVRCMSKAKYSTTNGGHYGLGFEYYSHFTSPIRRFSDLMVHRLLSEVLGNNGYPIT